VDRPMTLTILSWLFYSARLVFFPLGVRNGAGSPIEDVRNALEAYSLLRFSAALLHAHRTNW